MGTQDIKILIADQNITTSKKLATYLQDSGFTVQALHDGLHVENKILEMRPNFLLIDLTLPGYSALQCLEFLSKNNMLDDGDMRVFVLSQHNAKQNVEACLKAGAHDYIVKPVNPMDVLTRIALHLQSRKRLLRVDDILNEDARQANYYLHLSELLVKTMSVRATPHKVHFQLLRMLALAINAVRISLIRLDTIPTVIASSDNEKFTQFQLQLEKYPEVAYVQRTEKPLFIESLKDDAMMSFIKEQMKTVHFNSMIVLPIFNDGAIRGILSARLTESSNLSDADIRLCKIVAQIFSSFWHQKYQSTSKSA